MVNKGVILSAVILIILLAFFILGFKFGKDIPSKTACTEMYCDCGNNTGEMPCNSCGVENAVFLSGIINLYKNCDAREIIICGNGEYKIERIDVEKESCEYGWRFFEFAVRID